MWYNSYIRAAMALVKLLLTKGKKLFTTAKNLTKLKLHDLHKHMTQQSTSIPIHYITTIKLQHTTIKATKL